MTWSPVRRHRAARAWQKAREQHAELKAAKADVDRQLAELRAEIAAVRREFAERLLEARSELRATRREFDRLKEIERCVNQFAQHGIDGPTLQ